MVSKKRNNYLCEDGIDKSVLHNHRLSSLGRERSGSVVECFTGDRGVEPHRHHCVVVLEEDKFILA